jgi:hypothetical protein
MGIFAHASTELEIVSTQIEFARIQSRVCFHEHNIQITTNCVPVITASCFIHRLLELPINFIRVNTNQPMSQQD